MERLDYSCAKSCCDHLIKPNDTLIFHNNKYNMPIDGTNSCPMTTTNQTFLMEKNHLQADKNRLPVCHRWATHKSKLSSPENLLREQKYRGSRPLGKLHSSKLNIQLRTARFTHWNLSFPFLLSFHLPDFKGKKERVNECIWWVYVLTAISGKGFNLWLAARREKWKWKYTLLVSRRKQNCKEIKRGTHTHWDGDLGG